MVYEFAVKIKNIRNEEMLDMDKLNEGIAELLKKNGSAMEIKTMHDKQLGRDVLIKAQASVASYSSLHDMELDTTIEQFKSYVTEIEILTKGEASRADAFYHNNKTFSKIYT
jgi:hypothetical protein